MFVFNSTGTIFTTSNFAMSTRYIESEFHYKPMVLLDTVVGLLSVFQVHLTYLVITSLARLFLLSVFVRQFISNANRCSLCLLGYTLLSGFFRFFDQSELVITSFPRHFLISVFLYRVSLVLTWLVRQFIRIANSCHCVYGIRAITFVGLLSVFLLYLTLA